VLADEVAAVLLAAGSGTRLRPLTYLRPKSLCPVGDRPLLDHALERAEEVTDRISVNVHHGREQLVAHCAGRAHISVEDPQALETAGALGALRGWIDGRNVLTINADAWHPDELSSFVAGWDRERVRLLVVRDPERGDFGDRRFTGVALIPWAVVRQLPPERRGLYPAVIGPRYEAGELDLVDSDTPHLDCGTPGEYLGANLAAIDRCGATGPGIIAGNVPGRAERSVVGRRAVVEGEVLRSVVWPGAVVRESERLRDAVRTPGGMTVRVATPVRPTGVDAATVTVGRTGSPDEEDTDGR
jgi:N-acetyl-alpha-D-muramate 1-phosphate uridylyltransferase